MTVPSNANTSGLAPCPFCGGNPFDCGFRRWECGSCGAQGPAGSKADATNGWNRRVTAASAQARIDAAEARADRLAKALIMIGGERSVKKSSYPNTYRGGFDAATDLAASIARAALQQEPQK